MTTIIAEADESQGVCFVDVVGELPALHLGAIWLMAAPLPVNPSHHLPVEASYRTDAPSYI